MATTTVTDTTSNESTSLPPVAEALRPHSIHMDRYRESTFKFQASFTVSADPSTPAPAFSIDLPLDKFSSCLDSLSIVDSRGLQPAITFRSPTVGQAVSPPTPAWRAFLSAHIGSAVRLTTETVTYSGILVALQHRDGSRPKVGEQSSAIVLREDDGKLTLITAQAAEASTITVSVDPSKMDNSDITIPLPHAVPNASTPVIISPSRPVHGSANCSGLLEISYRCSAPHYPSFSLQHRVNVPHQYATGVKFSDSLMYTTAYVPNPTSYDLIDTPLYLHHTTYCAIHRDGPFMTSGMFPAEDTYENEGEARFANSSRSSSASSSTSSFQVQSSGEDVIEFENGAPSYKNNAPSLSNASTASHEAYGYQEPSTSGPYQFTARAGETCAISLTGNGRAVDIIVAHAMEYSVGSMSATFFRSLRLTNNSGTRIEAGNGVAVFDDGIYSRISLNCLLAGFSGLSIITETSGIRYTQEETSSWSGIKDLYMQGNLLISRIRWERTLFLDIHNKEATSASLFIGSKGTRLKPGELHRSAKLYGSVRDAMKGKNGVEVSSYDDGRLDYQSFNIFLDADERRTIAVNEKSVKTYSFNLMTQVPSDVASKVVEMDNMDAEVVQQIRHMIDLERRRAVLHRRYAVHSKRVEMIRGKLITIDSEKSDRYPARVAVHIDKENELGKEEERASLTSVPEVKSMSTLLSQVDYLESMIQETVDGLDKISSLLRSLHVDKLRQRDHIVELVKQTTFSGEGCTP